MKLIKNRWGGGYHFSHKGETHLGIHTRIDLVLDRFAKVKRQVITNEQAHALQKRLANKYTSNFGAQSVMRTLTNNHQCAAHDAAYPLQARRLDLAARFELLMVRSSIDGATRHHDGDYCLLGTQVNPCCLCDAFTTHQVCKELGGIHVVTSRIYTNSGFICKRKKCQSVFAEFPKAFGRKNYGYPLVNVLMEITKNESAKNNNHAHKRRLAQHFVRHARQVSKRRD